MSDTILIYLPLVSLAGWLSMFGLKHVNFLAGNVAGLVYHLSLIPLVARLPGGPEVVMAGYLWLYLDALIDITSINRIGDAVDWPLRMGVHLFAAIWICGVSWGLGGAVLWIGVPLGIGLGLHAVFGADLPRSRMVLGVTVLPLMSGWLIALAVTLWMQGLPLA